MTNHHSPQQAYRAKRRRQWDKICLNRQKKGRRTGRFYHDLVRQQYRKLIPPGRTVLELGCGQGDLLNAVTPRFGVGVDFSTRMISRAQNEYPHLHFICADVHQTALKTSFDVIILSDLVNDLWDVQTVFSNIAAFSHPGTRVIINFFNNIWKLPINLAQACRLTVDLLEQNWLTPQDITNLFHLTGFEPVRTETQILLPISPPLIEPLCNRILIHLPPFCWFGMTNFMVTRPFAMPTGGTSPARPLVSVIIPARNEAGNINEILGRTSIPGYDVELVFVEGGSTDNTWDIITREISSAQRQNCRLIRQPGKGKGDAVRAGFNEAAGDILIIYDADMTVPPEALSRFIEALVSGKGDFINGVRLVYPMEERSMRFLNMVGNKVFSLLLSWLLGQPVKDTLCGTKALWKKDYEKMQANPDELNLMDPFGDFALLLNAARINLRIVDIPVRYRRRKYGTSNISRWKHGWLLLKMIILTARRITFQ